MKQITLTVSLTLLTCLSIFGQKLTLSDLTNLCNKKNWEDVNQTLLTKGWVYYDSEKGSTYKYNTITWSFNKDYYNDKAQGWFYLYTYEGFPNKISYTVLNKESYSLIQNSISSSGFKLVNSEIEDNEVISTYGNTSYTLKISTEKRKDSDWSSRSLTAYNITLIKKAGIYDADNGKKTEYYYGDVVFNPNITYGSITDIDGNTYKTVTIGTQTWMAENLKVTKYNDGIAIPNVTDNTAWRELTTGALCDYGNTPSNSETYGKLYNWHAVNTGKLCPTGWHVPSDAEWTELTDYLGGTSVAGGKRGKLKETGTTHWNHPNTGATNETGFTALPGGSRYGNGAFDDIGIDGYWWSAPEDNTFDAWNRLMYYSISFLYRDIITKELGFSVRCLRD